MTDNLSYTWRYISLEAILPKSKLLDDLQRGGYYCAGDVLDVTAEQLAADVYGVGPKRAAVIRQKVFERIKPFQLVSADDDGAWAEIDPPSPRLFDTALTVVALIAVCLFLIVIGSLLL